MREAGLDAAIDGIANILGKSPASRPQGAVGLAPGKPEPCGMARRSPGLRLCAGGGAGHLRGRRNPAPRRRRRGVLRRGGPFRQLPRQPLVHRRCSRRARSTPHPITRPAVPMREALAAAGWSGRPRHLIDPSRYAAFFEAHIEQGDTLESTGLKIGVVTAIVAIWQYRFTVVGRAEPRRHDLHGAPARRRARAGAAAGRDRRALSRRSAARARCGPRGASISIPARRASSRARPKRCSNCATPTPPCSIGWTRRSTLWCSAPTARPLQARGRAAQRQHACPDGPGPAGGPRSRRGEATRPASTCACPRAPATTRNGSRASCRRP